MSDQSKSAEELEQEANRTRMEVAGTLNELRERLAPDTLKAEAKEYVETVKEEVKGYVAHAQEEVKDYARGTGEEWLRKLQAAALDQPLPTVMVAAGLTWMMGKIVWKAGVPGLLIGAGLAQVMRGGGSDGGRQVQESTDRSPEYRTYHNRGKEATIQDWTQAFAGELRHFATRALGSARATAGDGADWASSSARELAHEATSSAAEATLVARRRVEEAAREMVSALREVPNAYPIGLAAGAALAGAGLATLRSSRLGSGAVRRPNGQPTAADFTTYRPTDPHWRARRRDGVTEQASQALDQVRQFAERSPAAFIAGSIATAMALATLWRVRDARR